MRSKLARIKRYVRAGQWYIEEHCLDELRNDGFTISDLRNAILSTIECDELTDDPSHVR